jgi:lon-related putative ATP-dependent protease
MAPAVPVEKAEVRCPVNNLDSELLPLPAEAVHRSAAVDNLTFQTTAELDGDATGFIGHERAIEAMQFGMQIRKQGFNLYLLGSSGTGKHGIARSFLEKQAATEAPSEEWCYVNNFISPDSPRALALPRGRSAQLRDDMEALVEELRSAIPSAFESENYRARKQVIEHDVKDLQEKAFAKLLEEGKQKGLALVRTPTGIIMAPMAKGEIMDPREFEQLPETEHKRIEETVAELQNKVQEVLLQFPKWEQDSRAKIRELNDEVAAFAVGHLIDELHKKYEDLPDVADFLEDVRGDIIDHVDEFLNTPDNPLAALMSSGGGGAAGKGSGFYRRYEVNVLVEGTANGEGAPVVYEDHPTYQNLLGHVEYMAHMGALSTNFTLIEPGALHRANGGYLILDAYKVLTQPYAWDALKRSLRSSEIRIESLGEMLGLVTTASLRPEPIPLEIKVILVGERHLYYLLAALDSDFPDLFKVAADFDDHMDRNDGTEKLFANWIAGIAQKEALLPFERGAVGRLIEQSSREAGDSRKVLTLQRNLSDLLQEADHWARQSNRSAVAAEDVQRAIDARIRRVDRIRETYLEETLHGTILIDTEGQRVGQINGLSVIGLPGGFSFGHPSRITARVRLGTGEVVDIEREVELGGPIHSKGVLILAGFLGGRYAKDHPLSLHATLVFEQSYGGVEGDSASSAELYALLSALSGFPLKQSFAVTGSVNQHGLIQPIGGVNEKIEGFFDLCRARGLLSGQGVIIPRSNVRHLMLRQDVVDAVRSGDFKIHAISTIDQGIELLTGIPAGERDESGKFPEGTVNQKVEERLIALAERRIALGRKPEGAP